MNKFEWLAEQDKRTEMSKRFRRKQEKEYEKNIKS
jgi:hypothetical protein